MRIISLQLKGYLRLLNKGTHYIEYTPKANIQLILGQNGYGKSSILRELSPLPAVKGDYVKGGYKIIIVEHQGRQFKLTSNFEKGNHHSFISLDDGKEHNDGETGSVQKQLVKTFFGYTSDIHAMLLGKQRFTQLTPQKRREWLVDISNVDVSYAIKLFQKLQGEMRATQSVLKHTVGKLVNERAKLLSEDDRDALSNRMQKLTHEINTLRDSLENNINFTQSDEVSRQTLITKLESLGRQLIESIDDSVMGKMDIEVYKSNIHNVEVLITHEKKLQEQLSSEHDRLVELSRLMESDSSVPIEDIEREQKDKMDELSGLLSLDIEHNNPTEAILCIEELLVDYMTYKDLVEPNPELELYSAESVRDNKETFEGSRSAIFTIENRLEKLNSQITHMESHQTNLECPKCAHSWIPGNDEKELARLKAQIPQLESDLERYQKQLKESELFLSKADEWKQYYVRYMRYEQAYPAIAKILKGLKQDNLFLERPKDIVFKLTQTIEDLTLLRHKQGLEKDIEELKEVLQKRKKLESIGDGKVKQHMADLESKLSDSMQREVDHISKLNALKAHYGKLESIYRLETELDSWGHQLVDLEERKCRFEIKQTMQSQIQTQSQTLAQLTELFHGDKNANGIVEHLSNEEVQLTERLKHYQILLDVLSPSDGLIADTLLHFIRDLTDHVNTIIRQVWTTGIEVRPCHSTEKGLDYRFPVWSEQTNELISDISEASTGEMELIDFAFMLVTVAYLDLRDHPLYMDEVGRSFHITHRNRLFNYIKELTTRGELQQIFVISHYPDTHGALTNADVNVIDPTGVLITEEVNANFKINQVAA